MTTWTSDRRGSSLTVGVEQAEGSFVIRAAGEVDFTNAKLLQAALRRALDAPSSRITLDLQDVAFIDSMGLRVLLWGAGRSRECRTRLRIRLGSPAVRRVLERTGLDRALPLTG
jgi:anti-anti-sigma factor